MTRVNIWGKLSIFFNKEKNVTGNAFPSSQNKSN